jgi:DNA-binding CsgD family transcriptional regulator
MDPAIAKLSAKERRVLELLLQGLEVEEIGRRMQISPFTARTFIRNAGIKLSMIPDGSARR